MDWFIDSVMFAWEWMFFFLTVEGGILLGNVAKSSPPRKSLPIQSQEDEKAIREQVRLRVQTIAILRQRATKKMERGYDIAARRLLEEARVIESRLPGNMPIASGELSIIKEED